MQYSGLILNDITAAPGLCVSFFTQGCPHRCKGCHNPETWNFDGGKEFTSGTLNEIISGLTAQDIQRDLCIMGGEPLCDENAFLTYLVVKEVKEKVPGFRIVATLTSVRTALCKKTHTKAGSSSYII